MPGPSQIGTRFERALIYASRKHAGQTRKATRIPYISHLLAVASLVLEVGGDEDLAIAALLHDVVEDCGGRPVLREVRRKFGARVASIVEGCSDSFTSPKPPWRERKEFYLHHLRSAGPEERLVSAADKLHNARAILRDYRNVGEAVWQRFQGKRDGTLWYYRSLVSEFRRKHRNPLVDELSQVVRELERLGKPSSPRRKRK